MVKPVVSLFFYLNLSFRGGEKNGRGFVNQLRIYFTKSKFKRKKPINENKFETKKNLINVNF